MRKEITSWRLGQIDRLSPEWETAALDCFCVSLVADEKIWKWYRVDRCTHRLPTWCSPTVDDSSIIRLKWAGWISPFLSIYSLISISQRLPCLLISISSMTCHAACRRPHSAEVVLWLIWDSAVCGLFGSGNLKLTVVIRRSAFNFNLKNNRSGWTSFEVFLFR